MNCSRVIARNSSREATSRSISGSSLAIWSITPSGSLRSASTNGWMNASTASFPSRAALNSLTLMSARPSKKSKSGVRRRGGHHRADAQDPVAEQRAAGERVRGAAGAADHGEPLEAELVGDRRDIGRGVGNRPSGIGSEPP